MVGPAEHAKEQRRESVLWSLSSLFLSSLSCARGTATVRGTWVEPEVDSNKYEIMKYYLHCALETSFSGHRDACSFTHLRVLLSL
jgi:hypothetical protein